MEEILKNIYYNVNHPACYSSAEKLLDAAKREDPSISSKFVEGWLKSQLTYTLHKQARKRFTRNPIKVSDIDEQWEADIVEMQEFQSQNDGVRYILNMIDTFSKFAFSQPLKNKSGSVVARAFKTVFENRQPERIRTDKGKEFLNQDVQEVFKSYQIHHFTSNDSVIKCAIVERFNRTLKGKMFKYFTANGTRRFIDILQQLVSGYNKSYHRSIRMQPAQVNKGKTNEVFMNLYGNHHDTKPARATMGEGDSVRIKYTLGPFDKGFYPNWSDQVYTVTEDMRRWNRPMFRVKTEDGTPVAGLKYKEELQKVRPNLYRVETVVSQRLYKRKKQFRVKWMGYPESFNSWVDESDIVTLSL